MECNLVKIPEVLFFQEGPGVRKWQFKDKGVKLLNVGNINKGTLNLSTTKLYLSEEEAYGKYKHFLVDEGDLLIACSGIVVDNFHNKITFAKKEHLPLCMNTSTMRFKPLDENVIDLNYVKYYFQSRTFTDQLRKLITGSAQLNFGPSHIKKINIPLPPLPEQRRIAKMLDEADRVRRLNKSLISEYDQLTQSLFLEMFGDPVSNPMGWEKVKLKELYINSKEGTKCGPFGSALKKHEYTNIGIPVWVMDNINNNKFIEEKSLYITKEKFDTLKGYKTEKGDIIISRAGTVGKMAVIEYDGDAIISTNLIRLRLDKNKLQPEIFSLLMNNWGPRVAQLKTGGEGSFTHMNTGILNEINYPLPPLFLQTQFADRITVIEAQKQKAEESLKESENLFNALLQEVFA